MTWDGSTLLRMFNRTLSQGALLRAGFKVNALVCALVAGWSMPLLAATNSEFENPFQADNAVGFVLNDASMPTVYGVFDTDGTLTGSDTGTMALVFRFQVARKPKQIQVNARDVELISNRAETITMKDGKVYRVGRSMPLILVCDSSGACKNPVYRPSRYYGNERISLLAFFRKSEPQVGLGPSESRGRMTEVQMGPRDFFFYSQIRVLSPAELLELKSAIRAQ